jgi:hypothetical protein
MHVKVKDLVCAPPSMGTSLATRMQKIRRYSSQTKKSLSSDSLLSDYSTHTVTSTPTHPLSVHFCDQLNQILSHPLFNYHVQEYMHWRYCLNHASFPVMYHMAKSKLLPQHSMSILQKMHKSKQKPPLWNDCVCVCAKMCRKQWRQKLTLQPTYHSSLTLQPWDVVSVWGYSCWSLEIDQVFRQLR